MPGPYGAAKGKRVLAGRGGRHICRPYGVNRQVNYNRKRRGRDESLPYGVPGTGDRRAACPQAAAGVYGCEGGFGPSL